MRSMLYSVVIALGLFCSCCVTSISKDEIMMRDVGVTSSLGSGSGVLIDTSEHGSYILTAGHVVIIASMVERDSGSEVGQAVVADIKIVFEDGTIENAIFIKGSVLPVDYAILWIPKHLLIEPSTEEITYFLEPDDVRVETFMEGHIKNYNGVSAFPYQVFVTPPDEVRFGNSGGGVYNSSGRLIGIMISKNDKGSVGNITVTGQIFDKLEEAGLGHLISSK